MEAKPKLRVRGRIVHTSKTGPDQLSAFILELRPDGLHVRKKRARKSKIWPLDSLVNGVVTGQMDLFLAGMKLEKLKA